MQMTALLDTERQVAGWGAKAKPDVASGEHVAGESPHALNKIVKAIPPGIDGPHQVAHRSNHLSGIHGDLRQWFLKLMFRAGAPAQGFTDDSDLGKTCSDVVVKIGGDPGADSFQMQETPHAKAIHRIQCGYPQASAQDQEPPALPYRREKGESQTGRDRSTDPGCIYGPHQETIRTGRQAGIVHGPLGGERTPIPIRIRQHKLVAENLAGGEGQSKETDL